MGIRFKLRSAGWIIAIGLSAISVLSSCSNLVWNPKSSSSTTTQDLSAASDPAAPATPQPSGAAAYVDNYLTNQYPTASNYNTESTNAALGLLSGYDALWTSGGLAYSGSTPTGSKTAYLNGTVKNSSVLSANITYVANVTAARTPTQANNAFFDDRHGKVYSDIQGFGPLASYFYTGSGISTTLTSVPSDANVYAYNDGGNDYGNITSSYPLYPTVNLIQAVRSSGASSNPAKYYFNYARPWRFANNSTITENTTTLDTGYYAVDRVTPESYPTYTSSVSVDPYLLPGRSMTGYNDGGFPSGHTAEGFNEALLLAYAVPERFQELITRASELGNNRILAGMHSPLDVMGGRMLGTAITAAGLNNTNNATTKTTAFTTAHTYLEAQTNTTDATLYTFAHTNDSSLFSDWATNKANYLSRLTYGFSQINSTSVAAIVPKGAEVMLETRQPYLTAAQRREVLRTTAISSGYPLLDDAEGWGRLNLFAAADGYGSFAGTIYVNMDASQVASTHNNFYAADKWRNDISGVGRLVKQGSGTLTLTGNNSYSGGTRIEAGTLEAASSSALGSSGVLVTSGNLEVSTSGSLNVNGNLTSQSTGAVTCNVGSGSSGLITVSNTASLGGTLNVVFSSKPTSGTTITLIQAGTLTGTFNTVNFSGLTTNPSVSYSATRMKLSF